MRSAGLRLCLPATALVLSTLVVAATGPAAAGGERKSSPGGDEAQTVELFSAMEAGELEVKLIPQDAKRATVLITNNTDRPLRIALPEAFAGVPALRQGFGGPFPFGGGRGAGLNLGAGGGAGLGLGGGGGLNQGLGGGFGPLGGGAGIGGPGGGFRPFRGGGGPGPGGFFHVAPDKTVKIKVATVCLEHGKDDPHPRIAYTLVPLKSFSDDPRVREICTMLARGEIEQASAQAAAWHYTDDLSFQELAAKIGVKHLNGSTEPFFTKRQVARAMKIAEEAERRAAHRRTATSKTDSRSRK